MAEESVRRMVSEPARKTRMRVINSKVNMCKIIKQDGGGKEIRQMLYLQETSQQGIFKWKSMITTPSPVYRIFISRRPSILILLSTKPGRRKGKSWRRFCLHRIQTIEQSIHDFGENPL
jgi:hypothetical protein